MTSKTVKLVSFDVRYKSLSLIILPFEENATKSKASAKIRHFDDRFAHDFSKKTANTKYLTFINHLMKKCDVTKKQYGDEISVHSSNFRAIEQRIFRVKSSFRRRCLAGGPR